jgi:hypothetical protein
MKKVLEALKERGPLTGRELYEATGLEVLTLWRFCKKSTNIVTRRVSKRYLRFDREIKGYARLSPSVQREFLTYTVVGLRRDEREIKRKARALKEGVKRASEEKLHAAGQVAEKVVSRLPKKRFILENACFIIGGDVPLGMAHTDPRPEPSTGRLVSGSDLDIVVITARGFPEDLTQSLDKEMYKEKYQLLRGPHRRIEVDYIIKDLDKVEEQAKLRRFEDYVACKIIMESRFLLGSKNLFHEIISLLQDSSVPSTLTKLRKLAAENRMKAERILLKRDGIREKDMRLFATAEEYGEIF